METPLHHLINSVVTHLIKNKKDYTVFWLGILDINAYDFRLFFFYIKSEETERIVLANKILNHVMKIMQELHSFILTSDEENIKQFFPNKKVVELISNFLNIPIYYKAERGGEETKFFRMDSCIYCPPLRIHWDEESHKYAFHDEGELDDSLMCQMTLQTIAEAGLKPASSFDFGNIELKPPISFDFGEQKTNVSTRGGSNKVHNLTDDDKLASYPFLPPATTSSSTYNPETCAPSIPEYHNYSQLFHPNKESGEYTPKTQGPAHLIENQGNREGTKDPVISVSPELENFIEIPHHGKLFEGEKIEIKELFKMYKEILIRLNDNAGIHEKNIGILTKDPTDLKCVGCPIHCSPVILANIKAKRGPKSGSIKRQILKSDNSKNKSQKTAV